MRKRTVGAMVLALGSVLAAGETRTWEVAKRDAFAKGEDFENVVLTSRGELKLGDASSVVSVKDEPTFWCGVAQADGSILAGTGKGAIYRLQRGAAEKVGDTKEMLVTSLVESGGVVYAATIPQGRIFRQNGNDWAEFAKVDSKYVWKLAAAPRGGLYAACGGPGAVYQIDSSGRAETLHPDRADSPLKCDNVLSLHVDGDRVIAGTAAPGHLIEIKDGKARVLYDFGDGEVKALAGAGGAWYVAVNSGAKVPPSEFLNAVEKAKTDVQPKDPASGDAKQESAAPSAPPSGQSSVWRLAPARTERLVDFPASYITDLFAAPEGVYVGTNNSGRIFRVLADGSHELVFDFPEGQVLAFVGARDAIKGALMGQRAALRTLGEGRAAKGVYTSEVFDARFMTQWGRLTTRGAGRYAIQTRSGNIAKAGDGWSEWSAPLAGDEARVASPKGRYLQFRVTFEDPEAVLRSVAVAYKNENQRPRLREIKVEAVPARVEGQPPAGGERGPSPRLGEAHSNIKRIQWRGEDDDGDYLVYKLSYRASEQGPWIPLFRSFLPVTDQQWNTENVADGRYWVRVEVSDERANAREEALTNSMEFGPFLVDNGKPEIDVAVVGVQVRGHAMDRASNILRIEYSVDGGDWQAVMSKDRLFDDRREEFEFSLEGLAPGGHVLTMRVLDQESNVGTASRAFEIK